MTTKLYCIDQGGGKSTVNVNEKTAPTLCTTHDGAPVVATDYSGGADMYNGLLTGDVSMTLNSSSTDCHKVPTFIKDYEIRRLTPTECARLQGMPDWWCDDVPHTDSAEYKMWGNGMALPCVLYVMEGIQEALENPAESNFKIEIDDELPLLEWLDNLLESED